MSQKLPPVAIQKEHGMQLDMKIDRLMYFSTMVSLPGYGGCLPDLCKERQ
jgi:hypothetical protein